MAREFNLRICVCVGIAIERQELGALGDAAGVQIFDGIVHTIRSVSDLVRNAGRLKPNPPAVRLDLFSSAGAFTGAGAIIASGLVYVPVFSDGLAASCAGTFGALLGSVDMIFIFLENVRGCLT